MPPFIPHKKNPHTWRTMLFVVFVMSISGLVAYYFNDRLQVRATSANTAADNVKTGDQLVENMPVIQEEQSVKTEQAVVSVEDQKVLIPDPPKIERNKNPATKIEEAKTYTKPQITTGKYIDISLKYQNMVIFEDGKVLDAYQISSGKKGLDTPIGTFKIENKSPRAWSKKYSLWMPNWMDILPSGEVGIHELPVWPGGYQEGANHLGVPVSHGCVRLGVGPAKRVYDWADIGTPVIVHQ